VIENEGTRKEEKREEMGANSHFMLERISKFVTTFNVDHSKTMMKYVGQSILIF